MDRSIEKGTEKVFQISVRKKSVVKDSENKRYYFLKSKKSFFSENLFKNIELCKFYVYYFLSIIFIFLVREIHPNYALYVLI